MSWFIIWHDRRPEHPKIGDAWFMRLDDQEDNAALYTGLGIRRLSKKYDPTKRSPIVLMMPGYDPFCVDWMPVSKDVFGEDGGWDVSISGDIVNDHPLCLTLEPSVNVGGIYHGYVRNGIIGDDVEGRKFTDPRES